MSLLSALLYSPLHFIGPHAHLHYPCRIVHDDGTNSISLATLPLDPSGSTGSGYMAVGAASGDAKGALHHHV